MYVQFSKTSPLKSGESSEKSSGENRVESCHVRGRHGLFGPDYVLFVHFRNEHSAQRGGLLAGYPCGHPAKNFGQALQILENKHFGMDIPPGRP